MGFGRGPHDLEHSGIPILVSIFVIGSALTAMIIGRRYGARAPAFARTVAASLEGAWERVAVPHWRVLGAAGFLWLDMAALWAACRATGHPLGVLALAVALMLYLVVMRTRIGMLLRARASNREMIGPLGIHIQLLYTLVFGLGAALAGNGGADFSAGRDSAARCGRSGDTATGAGRSAAAAGRARSGSSDRPGCAA